MPAGMFILLLFMTIQHFFRSQNRSPGLDGETVILTIAALAGAILVAKNISPHFSRQPDRHAGTADNNTSRQEQQDSRRDTGTPDDNASDISKSSSVVLFQKGVCPECKEKISADYTKCFSCGYDFYDNKLIDS